jgi:hypothetical protein
VRVIVRGHLETISGKETGRKTHAETRREKKGIWSADEREMNADGERTEPGFRIVAAKLHQLRRGLA